MRSAFLRFFCSSNESLRLIIIYYMLKYEFGIKTTLLELLRSQKSPLRARFRHNLLKRLSFARCDLLRLVRALNESLRLIITFYLFKFKFENKTTLLESLPSQKSPLKARFRHNLLKGLSFCAKWLFKACWSSKSVPKTYYNTIYVQILIWVENNLARVTSKPKKPFKASI